MGRQTRKRKTAIRAVLFKSITIAQKVKLVKTSVTNAPSVSADQNSDEPDTLSIENLSQVHLNIIMSQLRDQSWTQFHERKFAVSVYMMLKLSGVSHAKIDEMMSKFGTLTWRTAHVFCRKIINGDEDCVEDENRGKYKRETIFDVIPELKEDILQYSINKVAEKNSKFTVASLAEYSIKKANEYKPELDPKPLLSQHFLEKTLACLGFYWGNNKARPYFQGHEREDVVKTRDNFVRYFSDNSNSYDVYVKNEPESTKCQKIYDVRRSSEPRRIIVSHDESTFRSGEIQSERWLHHQYSPLFSKGS